jgi:hypothetical protein
MCTMRRSILWLMIGALVTPIAVAAGVAATVSKTIETQISIKASPSKVWHILTDFSAMPSWNPFITAIGGDVLPGSRLSVTIAPPGQSGITFAPTVLAATQDQELRWLGTVANRWIFAGEHYFLLNPTSDGETSLIHGERFSGMLAPLIMRGRMLEATKDGFLAMNAALKRRSECDGQRDTDVSCGATADRHSAIR